MVPPPACLVLLSASLFLAHPLAPAGNFPLPPDLSYIALLGDGVLSHGLEIKAVLLREYILVSRESVERGLGRSTTSCYSEPLGAMVGV